jgi:glycosyltransferase involved in cell wall biosynthesis
MPLQDANKNSSSPIQSRSLDSQNHAKIKVLFAQTSLPGGDRSLYNILRNLDRDKFQLTLFLFKPECVNAGEISGSAELIIGSRHTGRVRYSLVTIFRRLVRLAGDHDIVVGSLELDPTYLAYLAARLRHKPVIGWVRIALKEYLKLRQRWHRPLVRAVYPRLDRVVFNALDAASSTRNVVRLETSKVAIIPSSLDPAGIEAVQRSGQSWQCPPLDGPLVMAVCRLNPEKGLDVLLRAHRRLRDASVHHWLAILGKGPLREELMHLASRLRVADTVMMPGYFANPYSAMEKASVFVLPSGVEGCPSVLLEALHLGLPIVSTNCLSGPSEILDGGRYGMLVPPDDDSALAEALGRLLNDPAKRAELSTLGRARARQYTGTVIADRWGQLFTDVFEANTRRDTGNWK